MAHAEGYGRLLLRQVNISNTILSRRGGGDLALKHDYFLTRAFYWYLSGLAERDRFKDLSLRATIGPGLGYQFFEGELGTTCRPRTPTSPTTVTSCPSAMGSETATVGRRYHASTCRPMRVGMGMGETRDEGPGAPLHPARAGKFHWANGSVSLSGDASTRCRVSSIFAWDSHSTLPVPRS